MSFAPIHAQRIVAAADHEKDGVAGFGRDAIERIAADVADVEARAGRDTELEYQRTEEIAARLRVLRDQALGREALEHPVHGRALQSRAVRDVDQSHALAIARSQLAQQACRALDALGSRGRAVVALRMAHTRDRSSVVLHSFTIWIDVISTAARQRADIESGARDHYGRTGGAPFPGAFTSWTAVDSESSRVCNSPSSARARTAEHAA